MINCYSIEPVIQPSCGIPTVEQGETHLQQLLCNADILPKGDGHRGDWVIANSKLLAVVRNRDSALSNPYSSGGSLIDISIEDSPDLIVELLPFWQQKHPCPTFLELHDTLYHLIAV